MRSIVIKTEHVFYLLISLLLLSYTGYRCATLSFTHDESYSFINIIHGTFYHIVSNDSYWISANNHILNSLCMKYSEMQFGPNEFNLRMHSFFAHIVYLLFTFLLIKNLKSKPLQIIGFLFLNLNPYLLDFFSLARGYALSIAFMVMSVYYFIEFTKKESLKYIFTCLFTALLATLANFSMITFTVAVIFLFECFMIIKRYKPTQLIIKNIPIVLAVLCLYSLYRWPITQLITHGQLFFGGDEGLWKDTVISSIEVFLYHSSYTDIFIPFFKFSVIALLVAYVYIFYKKIKQKTFYGLDYVFFIMIMILGINYTQHFFMETSYFKERFAMFLVPLFFLSLINALVFFWEDYFILKTISSVFALVTIVVIALICKSSLNTSYTYNWQYDADTKKLLNDLSFVQKLENRNSFNLGITWLFEPTINFYRETKKLYWLAPVNRDGVKGDYDFYYVHESEYEGLEKTNKLFIKNYSISKATLFKKIK